LRLSHVEDKERTKERKKETNKQANKQTNKQANKQANNPNVLEPFWEEGGFLLTIRHFAVWWS